MKFKENKPTFKKDLLTPELAKEIYIAANGFNKASDMINSQCGFAPRNVKRVFKLAKKIVNRIDVIMGKGNAATKTVLKNKLSSDYLVVLDVLNDYMDGVSWVDFKASYVIESEV